MATASAVGLAGPNDGQFVAVTEVSVYSLTVQVGEPQNKGVELTFQPAGAPTLKLP